MGRELGVTNLKIIGLINNFEELISSFDIGVVASVGSEMICRVLLEYYAAGLAVVGTAINQVEELINLSKAAILVPPKDPTALADSINRLIEDETLRNDLGIRAKEWVNSRASISMLGSETERFLQGIING